MIASSGNDPYLSHTLAEALPAATYTLHLTMSSTARGSGQLFWQEEGVRPAFHRDRSTTFAMTHDGAAHEYRVELTPRRRITALRLDPGQGAGEIRVSSMRFAGSGGETLREWSFAEE